MPLVRYLNAHKTAKSHLIIGLWSAHLNFIESSEAALTAGTSDFLPFPGPGPELGAQGTLYSPVPMAWRIGALAPIL